VSSASNKHQRFENEKAGKGLKLPDHSWSGQRPTRPFLALSGCFFFDQLMLA
jgi:hypothetical protein